MLWQWSRNLDSKVSFSPTLDMDDFLPAILLSRLPMDYDFSVAGGQEDRRLISDDWNTGKGEFLLHSFSLLLTSLSKLSFLFSSFPPFSSLLPFLVSCFSFQSIQFLAVNLEGLNPWIFVISQKVDEQTMEKHAVIIFLVFLVKTATKMRENVL